MCLNLSKFANILIKLCHASMVHATAVLFMSVLDVDSYYSIQETTTTAHLIALYLRQPRCAGTLEISIPILWVLYNI